MKYLKRFEEINPVEFVAPVSEHPSYKEEEKKKKRKKRGEIAPVITPPNHTKDMISFKRSS